MKMAEIPYLHSQNCSLDSNWTPLKSKLGDLLLFDAMPINSTMMTFFKYVESS
jgi:hypothetical protein